jgi:myosin heavy subunit
MATVTPAAAAAAAQEAAGTRTSKKRNSIRFHDVPQEDLSSTIWIPDKLHVWIRARIIQQDENVLHVQSVENGALITVDTGFEEIHKINSGVVADMTALLHIHEPGILHNLKERNTIFCPYTYMGTVMIAVNPLRVLPEANLEDYNSRPSDRDSKSGRKDPAPHPYAMAELAFQQLSFSGTNQSLVISGESGAGKTETAKILLKYLVARCRDERPSMTAGSDDLDNRLLQSSPILESFGNAKTIRNNNSSRFGKFMKLLFTGKPSRGATVQLTGAVIETYLLEKSRVINISDNERNYHVFYQLLAGCNSSLFRSKFAWFQPQTSMRYRMLNQSSCSEIPGVSDSSDFEKLWKSLTVVGMTESQVVEIMKVLVGLLHLGNVEFSEKESVEGTVANADNPHELAAASEYLGVPGQHLTRILTERTVWTRGEQFTIALSSSATAYARDACVKCIYEKVFEYLVQQINDSLAQNSVHHGASAGQNPQQFIGVLDIFGFENFSVNGFNQLLINFANESLQNTFNAQIFDAEIKLYESENIQCVLSSKPENSECVDMFLNRNYGIFQLLDNTCRQPKPLDEKYCDELHKKLGSNRYFINVHPKEKKYNFCVKHFAGRIKYTVAGGGYDAEDATSWVDNNNDSSPDGLVTLLEKSSIDSLRRLNFADANPGHNVSTGSKKTAERRPSLLMKPTIITSFAKSMSELNSLLNATSCLFIRCIKPNMQMKADSFDNSYVVEQLRSLGILQTCEVLKVGLPTRIPYQELKAALAGVIAQVGELVAGASESVVIACILQAYSIPDDIYKLGRTKVFFKAGQFSVIRDLLQSVELLSASQRQEVSHKISELLQASHSANEIVETLSQRISYFENSLNATAETLTNVVARNGGQPCYPSTDIINDLKADSQQSFLVSNLLTASVDDLRLIIETANKSWSRLLPSLGTTHETRLKVQSLFAKCELKMASTSTDLQTLLATVHTCNQKLADLQVYIDYQKCISVVRSDLDVATDSLRQARFHYLEAADGASRCQLRYTEERADKCQEFMNNIQFRQDGIDNLLSSTLSGSFAAVDTEEVTQLVQFTNQQCAAVHNCVDEVKAMTVQISQLIENICVASSEDAVAASTVESVPSPTTSSEDAAATAGQSKRRTSVKYTAKDLASMRAAGTLAVPNKSPRPTSTSRDPTSGPVEVQTPLPDGGVGEEVKAVETVLLPEGWKECQDKVSGRLFYVNK